MNISGFFDKVFFFILTILVVLTIKKDIRFSEILWIIWGMQFWRFLECQHLPKIIPEHTPSEFATICRYEKCENMFVA